MNNVKAVIGDTLEPNYRFGGNAMIINDNFWVQLTDGVDPLPTISSNQNWTWSTAYIADNFGQQDQFAITTVLGTIQSTILGIQAISTFLSGQDLFLGHQITLTVPGLSPAGNMIGGNDRPLRKKVTTVTYNGNLNNITSMRLLSNSRDRGFGWWPFSTTVPAFTNVKAETLTIGRFNDGRGRLKGKIRSIEWLNRALTNEEIRATDNYGTIYDAYQAGKIDIPDLSDLISIDFNRQPGEKPICRPNTRRLTVTCYNNTTVVENPTNYVDWNSL